MEQYQQPMLAKDAMKSNTVAITGGGTGLGRSMAKGILEAGGSVWIGSRREEVIAQAAQELAKECDAEGRIGGGPVDVRDQHLVDSWLRAGVNQMGPINGLLNNAAGNFISPTERLSSRAFDIIIDIVLKGSKNCTLAFGNYWIENKIPATVLNIVTTYAWTGSSFVVPSATAKAGVLAMTRSLAVEWAKYDIRMNAIAPGPFPTKGAWDRLFPPGLAKELALENKVPLKRVGDHQELANLATYLLSDFSAYINGEVITIDGGEWINGAGQFNRLDQVTPEMWDQLEKQIRSKK
jgi:NAD(P)-dependent dehydrogenase (short-subunit alcohol dehydrogenase family)